MCLPIAVGFADSYSSSLGLQHREQNFRDHWVWSEKFQFGQDSAIEVYQQSMIQIPPSPCRFSFHGFAFCFLVLPSLIDRLGDAKDSVREQDQTLLLKIMDQAANPQVGPTKWPAGICVPTYPVAHSRGNNLSQQLSTPSPSTSI